jgi:hypothetical protein
MNYTFKRTIRTVSADGKHVEEVVEEKTGQAAKEEIDKSNTLGTVLMTGMNKMPEEMNVMWKAINDMFK